MSFEPDYARRLLSRAEHARDFDAPEDQVDLVEDFAESLQEIERLQDELADVMAERDRLRAALKGAKWCGWLATDNVAVNVFLWNLPNCDGRLGATPEEASRGGKR